MLYEKMNYYANTPGGLYPVKWSRFCYGIATRR